MAIARCVTHSKPRGITKSYDALPRSPAGDGTAIVCGIAKCEKPASIWLDTDEAKDYEQKNARVFSLGTELNGKVRVK